MRRRLLQGGCIVFASLLFAGCATEQPALPGTISAENALPYHDRLEAGGRLSVRYETNGREETIHGSFAWHQEPQQIQISLFSPLGQTIAVIDVGPAVSTLAQAGQPARSAADPDALAADTLGWPLPVSGLRYWLQGWIENPGGRRMMIPPGNQNIHQTADGWRIRYVSWEAENTAAQRPKRIDLERNTAQAGPVMIRIVIDSWLPG